MRDLYISGEYLLRNPTWYVGDFPWQAIHPRRLLFRAHRDPAVLLLGLLSYGPGEVSLAEGFGSCSGT